MLLGAQRKTLSGFSSTSVLPHTGYIYHSDIVQSLPPVSPSPCPLSPATRPYLAWLAVPLRLLEDTILGPPLGNGWVAGNWGQPEHTPQEAVIRRAHGYEAYLPESGVWLSLDEE